MINDLIRRQDAIDALLHNQEVYANHFGNDPIDKYTIALIDNDAQTIAQLPTAEPEKCENCGNFNKARLLIPQPEQKWIPVSERLPEDEKEVLVTRHFLSDNQLKKNAITESFYVEVASRMGDEWTSYSDEYKIKRHLHKVIAWMPLPEPYKEEKNDAKVR